MPRHEPRQEVYAPAEDSFLLQDCVINFCRNRAEIEGRKISNILDIGTGTGIQAISASSFAQRVIAADVNEEALKVAGENIREKGIKNIKLIKSDLFKNIPRQKFELILFNPPYLPAEKRQKLQKSLAVDGGKKGSEIIWRFLKSAKAHLADDGAVLLLFSTLTGDVERILERCGYKFKKIAEEKLFMEKLLVYELRK